MTFAEEIEFEIFQSQHDLPLDRQLGDAPAAIDRVDNSTADENSGKH